MATTIATRRTVNTITRRRPGRRCSSVATFGGAASTGLSAPSAVFLSFSVMQSVCFEAVFFWAKAHKGRAPKDTLCALEFDRTRFQIQLTERAEFLCSNALHRNSPFGGGMGLLAIF